ncbi:MAG: M14 family metallopeptidase, partial [Gemmatimonadaceae bacterium]
RTASMAVLDYASKYREELLWNRYQAGRNAINKYSQNPPYAYIIPQQQRDPGTAADMLRRLAFNGVRVEQLDKDAMHDGVKYPGGTWVIPMDQEYAELVRQLFEPQEYPDLREYPDGPPDQPYDAAGWTLPYQMDVRVVQARVPLTPAFRASLKPVQGKTVDWHTAPDAPFTTNAEAAGIVPPPARITGRGEMLSVDPAQNDAFKLINRALAAGGAVQYEDGGARGGRYIVSGVGASKEDAWANELSLRAEHKAAVGASATPVHARIAVYKPWTASMDEGWIEWLLDQYQFHYSIIDNADVQAGDLGSRFDVVLIASDRPRTIIDGFAKGTVPPRYEGGIGDEGVRALDTFVREGGTIVCLNASSDFAIQALHLPVKNVVAGLPRKDYFASGSILDIITDPSHPVMAGMPEHARVFSDGSPVFTTLDGFEGSILAKYQKEGSPRVSGYLLGEKYIDGYAAAVDVKHGRGHAILLGFRPQWRGQPFGTFRVVFNSTMYSRELADKAKGAPGFWTAPPKRDEKAAETPAGGGRRPPR